MHNVTDDRTEPGPAPDSEVPAETTLPAEATSAAAPAVMANVETEIDADNYETPEVPARKPKMFNKLSVCLAFLLAVSGGFYGGVYMQKRHTPTTTAASTRGGFGGGRNAAAAAAGGTTAIAGATGGAAAGAGGGTRGTVVLVDAPNHAIYIQDSQGNAIKVAVSSDTIMKFSKTTTDPNDYAIGATVTVIGATDAATGNITATAITEGAARGGGGGVGTGAGTAAGAGTATGGAATTASTTAKSG